MYLLESGLSKLKPGPMDEPHIAIVCREILEGLVYLHRQGKVRPNHFQFKLDSSRHQSSKRPPFIIR
jgi:serine/threonine protein kinase